MYILMYSMVDAYANAYHNAEIDQMRALLKD
jgi:hypothetical protein